MCDGSRWLDIGQGLFFTCLHKAMTRLISRQPSWPRSLVNIGRKNTVFFRDITGNPARAKSCRSQSKRTIRFRVSAYGCFGGLASEKRRRHKVSATWNETCKRYNTGQLFLPTLTVLPYLRSQMFDRQVWLWWNSYAFVFAFEFALELMIKNYAF